MTTQPTPAHKKQIGQSLVEVALFLPIFVILLAGIVEISQLVITQNRISNAARVATRFGSNGGEDPGMVTVALNSITQTLNTDEARWDMWAIRGVVAPDGSSFTEWTFDHIYGISQTVLYSDVNETAIQQKVLQDLQTNEQGVVNNAIAGDLRIVGAYILHDVDSIIGLDAFPALAEVSSARALNVMRVTGLNQVQTNGCSAFPIIVDENIRSVTDPNDGIPQATDFPDASAFTYPSSPPQYNYFTNHVDDIPLLNAKEGYLYLLKSGAPGTGSFGWLRWNTLYTQPNSPALAASLTWPGNSNDYPYNGYYEPDDPTDTSMNVDDWVATSTGVMNSNDVRTQLEAHIAQERTLRVLIWKTTNGQSGVNLQYQISGFAIFRFHGYRGSSGQGGPWILGEFIRMDTSCGQVVQ